MFPIYTDGARGIRLLPGYRTDVTGLTQRRQVEDRPAEVPTVVRVRREWLDMFGRICAAHLVGSMADAMAADDE